eukprot:949414_1
MNIQATVPGVPPSSVIKPSENSSLITKSTEAHQQRVATWDTSQATSIPVAILNLVKSLIGAALLSLPWAFSQSTFIPGVIGLGFSVIYSFITCMFVINGCQVKDGIHGVDKNLAFPHDITIYKAIICFCVLLPLSLLKEFKSLKASSIIGNAATLYCVLLTIGYTIGYATSIKSTQDSEGAFVWNDWNANILIVVNVCAKGYASQYPLPPMFEQLKDRSVSRMRVVVISAFSIVTVIYLAFTFCGYYLYGASTQGDVLLSYPSNDVWFIMARFAMCLNVIGTYPLIFKSLLQCIEDKFFNYQKGAKYNFVEHPRSRTVVICVVSLVLMLIGIFISNVGPVSSIEGAVTILGLMSIFPVLVAWKIGAAPEVRSISVQYTAVHHTLDVNEEIEKDTTARRNRFVYVFYLGVVMFIGFTVGMAGIILQISSCASGTSNGC